MRSSKGITTHKVLFAIILVLVCNTLLSGKAGSTENHKRIIEYKIPKRIIKLLQNEITQFPELDSCNAIVINPLGTYEGPYGYVVKKKNLEYQFDIQLICYNSISGWNDGLEQFGAPTNFYLKIRNKTIPVYISRFDDYFTLNINSNNVDLWEKYEAVMRKYGTFTLVGFSTFRATQNHFFRTSLNKRVMTHKESSN